MRTILFVLALLGAVAGRAQIFLDWYSSAAPAAGLLLDDYPNATGAWSLRLLNTAYTGNCIEVRRASTNTNQNIGFVGGVVDTATLKTFCASTDCFVRTWYDQSTNARNLTNTTNAQQPAIVIGGAVLRSGGEPIIDFDGTDDHLAGAAVSNFLTASAYTFFSVALADTITTSDASGVWNNAGLFSDAAQYVGLFFLRNANRAVFYNWDSNNDNTNVSINIDQEYLFHQRHDGGQLIGNVDAGSEVSIASGNTSVLTGALRIGRSQSFYLNGHIKEAVFWNTNQSGNIAGIRSNINNFYTIY